jgi:hypothetical protein
MRKSCTTVAPQASSNGAYPSPKDKSCYKKYTRGLAVTMRVDFCEDHHIRVDWASVAHPMTNGQVERANGMILQGLKPRIYNDLNKFGKRWIKELPSMVWILRTTPSRATGFSPFFLVYGAEAILPTDLEYGSPRTKAYDDQSNQTNQEDSLDQLEEAQDVALLHSARYQ